jgi:hypothetical protein
VADVASLPLLLSCVRFRTDPQREQDGRPLLYPLDTEGQHLVGDDGVVEG